MTDARDGEFPVAEPTWRLDSIFEGGVDSESFRSFLEALPDEFESVERDIEAAPPLSEVAAEDDGAIAGWSERLNDAETLRAKLREAISFARVLSAAHADDEAATRLPSRVGGFRTRWDRLEQQLVEKFRGVDDATFETLTERAAPEIPRTTLSSLRRRAGRAMSPEEEDLAADLGRDGLHAWGHHYRLTSGRLTVSYAPPGEDDTKELSIGRAKGLLSDSNRGVRREAFESLQQVWSDRSPEFASMLSHVVGGRRTLADRRGVDVLVEPLENNRVDRETVEAMWDGVSSLQTHVRSYLEAKGAYLSGDALEWFDLRAPVGEAPETGLDWEEAQAFVVDGVAGFSERMAEFYREAFQNRWVEAEERDGKAQGAFCSAFPLSDAVRVFMTFGGTLSDTMTLAHELGHAYHFDVLAAEPIGTRRVPMTLAETASTLSERAVESAAIRDLEGARRLHLLDGRLQRATTFLLDIPARYQLEHRMLEARRDGPLSSEDLSEMTETAFREQFGDKVASIDRFHWASKLHYYLTREPFYNFPYTFGYLFSRAVHRRLTEGGPDLEGGLDDLLRDTGRMSAEELAKTHLGADLHDPDFWRSAGASLEEAVGEFRTLAKSEV